MKNKVFLIFLFVGVSLGAQSFQSKTLKGKITTIDGDITGVVVQNTATGRATITDVNGEFEIQIKFNDTLVFSALQFKRKEIPVTQALMQTSFITVALAPFVNELREVTVNPYGLSGELGKDINTLRLPKNVSAEALGLPNADVKIISQSERKLQEAAKMKVTGGGGFGGAGGALSLNPIINAITGRTKMLKKRVAREQTYARTQRVRQFYLDSIFEADLKIPKQNIADFMYFCEIDSLFQSTVATGDRLKLWDFLVDKSSVYRQNNGLE